MSLTFPLHFCLESFCDCGPAFVPPGPSPAYQTFLFKKKVPGYGGFHPSNACTGAGPRSRDIGSFTSFCSPPVTLQMSGVRRMVARQVARQLPRELQDPVAGLRGGLAWAGLCLRSAVTRMLSCKVLQAPQGPGCSPSTSSMRTRTTSRRPTPGKDAVGCAGPCDFLTCF